ncbi:MAG TPA: DUF1553 domain-containing protein, partial [Armatimonadota bacterium]|nr:DUF1553 domain-containing protein [Armatimonadota bacterium]
HLYDRALTAAEIEASFRGGPPVVSEAAARAALTPEEAATRARSVSELARVRAELETLTEKALTYGVTSTPAPAVHVLDRGDVLKKGELVTAAGLSCLPGLGAELGLAPDAPSGAQRAKLAEWITRQDNPLTPRVMANRIWQYHFGRGIAGSPSDFGVNGEPPTHPELLDWLASYFISADRKTEGRAWSVKKLHRLIVTSNTYRQSGQLHPRAAALDAENRLLWRMSPRRLEAEELRDAVLAVSGQLNLREGGPGFRPFSLVISNSYFYTYEDKVGPEFNRRSIYRTVVNSGGVPLLEAFDCPDPSVKTPRRGATTTPLQALMLLNNSFILREAKELARGLKEAAGPDPARQVATAYRRAFGRSPTPAEARRAEAFVKEHGLAPFCRVLFNASEFLYVP